MKITIQGYSGAGKSTLADTLGRMLGLPVLHLDSLNFSSGWVERDSEDMKEDIRRFMDENAETGWVIDGNYKSKLGERRLEEADRILLLTPNRFACFFSVSMCRIADGKRRIEQRIRFRHRSTSSPMKYQV